jgi:hypothetical protein
MSKKFYHLSKFNLFGYNDNMESNQPGIVNSLDKSDGRYNSNKRIIFSVIASIFITILGVSVVILITRSTDYEHGVNYLRDNDLNSALIEFKKVQTDDRNYEMAQSKINYINGVIEYDNSNLVSAQSYLSQVEENDEFYNESRLMLERIKASQKTADLNSLIEKVKKVRDDQLTSDK